MGPCCAGAWRASSTPGKSRPLPFFIEWGADTPYPGEALAQTATIGELRLQGDTYRIARWSEGADVQIEASEGQPALLGVVVDQAVLDPTLWA